MTMRRYLCLLLCLLLCSTSFAEEDFSNTSTEELTAQYNAIWRELVERKVAAAALPNAENGTQEIRFRNLPWGGSLEDVQQSMKEAGFLHTTHFVENPGSVKCWAANEKDSRGFAACGAKLYQYVTPTEIRVAGYPVGNVTWSFHYDIDGKVNQQTHLYMVSMELKSEDGFMAQADLTNKLISLYGAPVGQGVESSRYNSSQYGRYEGFQESTVWYGSNNTALRLVLDYKVLDKDQSIQDAKINLIYGLSDSVQTLTALDSAVKREKIEAEQKRIEDNANNTDGL